MYLRKWGKYLLEGLCIKGGVRLNEMTLEALVLAM